MTTTTNAETLAGMTIPSPGLQGDYAGACAVCLQGTDTGLAFQGEAEWCIAGLTVLGIPQDQAEVMFVQSFGGVPEGPVTMPVQVCSVCVSRTRFPAPTLLAEGRMPVIKGPA